MADVTALNVRLHGAKIGSLTHVPGDRTLFSFTDDYVTDQNRPTLGLSFKDEFGALITQWPTKQKRLLPYFSNLLPEGHLRDYLAARAGVHPEREFFLLWALGRDLPGALTVERQTADLAPGRMTARTMRKSARRTHCGFRSPACSSNSRPFMMGRRTRA